MIEQTLQDLTHADAAVRYAAVQALGKTDDSRAVNALIDALKDNDSKVQYASVSGLVKHADPRAIRPIPAMLLNDPTNRVWELMKLNIGLRLRMGLLNMVAHGDSDMAAHLLEAIAAGTLDNQQCAFLIRMIGRTVEPTAFDMLLGWLSEDDLTIRSAAADALGWMGDARAVEPLLAEVDHPSGVMRELAVESLGRLNDNRAYDRLVAALQDNEEWVRRAAAVALGELKDARAMEPLVAALADESQMVQDAAFEAVKQLSSDNFSTTL